MLATGVKTRPRCRTSLGRMKLCDLCRAWSPLSHLPNPRCCYGRQALNVTLTVGSGVGVPFYYNSGHPAFYRYFNISARPGAPSILRVGRAAVPVGSMEHAWPQQTSQQRTRPPPSLTRRRCHSALASLTDTCAHAHAHVTCTCTCTCARDNMSSGLPTTW